MRDVEWIQSIVREMQRDEKVVGEAKKKCRSVETGRNVRALIVRMSDSNIIHREDKLFFDASDPCPHAVIPAGGWNLYLW